MIDINPQFDEIELEPLEDSLSPEGISSIAEEQIGNTNEILAEMCFLEAEDLLSRGDRSGAISSYQQAYKYAPKKINYCLKLVDLLAEEINTYKEAEQILNKTLEIFPNNLELNVRLNDLKNKFFKSKSGMTKDLQNALNSSEITTQKVMKEDIKAAAAAMGVDLEKAAGQIAITQDAASILKEIDELESKSNVTASLSKKKLSKDTKPLEPLKPAIKEEKAYIANDPNAILKEIDELEAKTSAITSQLSKKKSTKNLTEITTNNKPNTSDNPNDILKEINDLETKSLTTTLKTNNTRKLTETASLENNTTNLDKTKKLDRTKFGNTKYISSETTKPKFISRTKSLTILFIFLITFAAFGYQLTIRPTVSLIGPKENVTLTAKDIKFEWLCDKKVAQFVLEVYEEDKFIIKEFTKETSYSLKAEQLALLQPDHKYRWRVILPVGFTGDYTLASEMKTFQISEPFTTIKTDQTQQTDRPTKKEIKPEVQIPTFIDRKDKYEGGEL